MRDPRDMSLESTSITIVIHIIIDCIRFSNWYWQQYEG